MERYHQTGPRDSTSAPAGDSELRGVFMVAPDKIPEGFAASARNCVFDDRVAETRPGQRLLPWLNPIFDNAFLPWSDIHGFAPFRDPNGREWAIIAADGGVYRTVENNAIFATALPAGVVIRGPVNFIQAFNVMLLQQGVRLPTLVLSDIGEGFELMVPDWDPADTYAEEDRVAYGDEVKVASIAVGRSSATITTSERHEYQTGDRVYLYFDPRAALGTAFAIEVTGNETFTVQLDSDPGALAPVSMTAGAVATLATATSVAHGLVTGRKIVVSGANEAEYNGEFEITRLDANTFTYVMTGSPADPATGTLTWLPVVYASRQTRFYVANASVSAGESPITTPSKWDELAAQALHAIVPWTLGGVFLQNRVFFPFEKDLVAASNSELYTETVAQVNTLRINQGDADALVALAAFNKEAFVAFKRGSIYLAGGLSDLSTGTLDRIPASYGCIARRSVAVVGADIWFLSQDGVRSLYQTTNNEVLGRDQRMSLPIDPLLKRLNTTLASEACGAFCAGKYYLAVPLDSGRTVGPTVLYSSGKALLASPVNIPVALGGVYYYSTNEDDASELYNGGTFVEPNSYFTAATTSVQVRGPGAKATTVVYDLNLQRVYVGNNTILCYNTKTEAWEGEHTGVLPKEFAVITVNGRERLFYAGLDGLIYLYGEGRMDQVYDTSVTMHVTTQDIPMEVVSRGYNYAVSGLKRFTHSRVALSTWRPSYSVLAQFDGVRELQTLAEAVTKSRSAYFDPWDRTPFALNNLNDDHAEPGREDYSVALDVGESVYLGTGIDFERNQESSQVDRITHGRRDRVCQLIVRNTQGHCRVNAFELTGEAGAREAGVHQ